jgi:eukaryotic-like serine/threonine-protein kinase
VYRAYDTRLRRQVALKVVRPSADSNPTHGFSLLHEARAAGALNHPNILVVYDVGTEQGLPYIVSELVDGTSLREAMDAGPLTVKTVLDIGVQIADGLTAAHEAGIVHRDLKPENVMRTRDGRAKILDFGVAKIEGTGGMSAGNQSLTDTAHSLVPGTAPYMSPEQARGRNVDFRSDQFSFGLLLYEMVAGARAFSRETPVQTLSAIIEDEPPPLSEISPRTPLLLRWVIERCLAKDPVQRYAATSDLARDLRMLRDRLTEAATAGVAPSPRARRIRWTFGGAAVVSGAALLFMAGLGRPERPHLPAIHTPLANDFTYQGEPAWSPDGKLVAYAAAKDGVLQIFKRSLDSPQSDPVTDSRWDCRSPFWSPDSSRIYYISQYQDKEGLFSIGAAGGQPEPIMPDVFAADLSKDGRTLAFVRDEGRDGRATMHLWLASPPSAEPRRYVHRTFGDRPFSDATLRFSPDSSRVELWIQNWSGFYGLGSRLTLWDIPVNGGEPHELPNEIGGLPSYVPHFDWLGDGRRIVAGLQDSSSDRPHLWIIDTVSGALTALTTGPASEDMPAVSPNGQRIAYATQDVNFDLFEVPIDGAPAKSLLATTRNEMEPSWSPTSDEFAFVSDSRGRKEIRRRSYNGSFEQVIVDLTDLPSPGSSSLQSPTFSPDGRRVAFEITTSGAPLLYGSTIWVKTLGSGPPVPIAPAKGANSSPTWSPNGQQIALALGTPEGWSLAVANVGVKAPPTVIHEKIWPFSHPQWSPDNHWIVCNTPDGLALIAPDGKGTKILDPDLWVVYGWNKDGSTVYGIKQDPDDLRQLMLVAADVAHPRLRIINQHLAPVPPANQLVKGFSRMSNGNFITSLVHVRSDVWLLDHFESPTTWMDRLRPGAR